MRGFAAQGSKLALHVEPVLREMSAKLMPRRPRGLAVTLLLSQEKLHQEERQSSGCLKP